MNFNFLKDNKMDLLIPNREVGIVEPTFTISYSEDDIRRICREHLNRKFNLGIDEADFYIDLNIETDMDGYEVKDFYCQIDEDILSDEDAEMLEDAGYLEDGNYFDNALRTILYEEFNNPDFVDVEAFLGPDKKLIIVVSMPLTHYDVLKKKSDKPNYLEKPLTKDEILKIKDENNYIEGTIAVHEDDLLYTELDNFLELISNKLCGDEPLYDINYKMVGCVEEKHLMLYSVSGDATYILENIKEV